MYHIEGITPEALTLEAAIGNKKIKETITITDKDLAETRERLCREPKKIDFAMFGCPHITINQVATIARVCEGRKFKVPVWLLTSSLTKELAVRMGYNDIIQRAGGHIVSDTCIDVPPCWQPYYHGVGVTDSPKCAYYNEIRDIEFIIRPIEEAVEAAIIGEVVKITKGKVECAEALVSKDAICFYLVEPETGIVKERNHDALGKSVVGKILIMPSGKGSSVVQLDGLYKLMMRNNAPAAIVVQEADTVLVAAVAAMETPMVHRVDPEFFQAVETGMKLSLNADDGTITIL